jgi:hypothetical protein
MTSIYSDTNSLAISPSNFFKKKLELGGELAGRVYSYIQNFSEHMQNNRNIVIMTIITANIIFFTLINRLANSIDKLMYPIDNLSVSDQEQLYHKTHDQKIRNIFLFDVGFMGGSTLLFNKLVLPKITNYPLSRAVVLAITGTAVVTRIMLRMYSMMVQDEEIIEAVNLDKTNKRCDQMERDLDLLEQEEYKGIFFEHLLNNNPNLSNEELEEQFQVAWPLLKTGLQKLYAEADRDFLIKEGLIQDLLISVAR